MVKLIRFVAVLSGLVLGCSAAAQAPVWYLDEVFSNADGSVQFVMYSAYDSGQQYLAGYTLVATTRDGSKTHTFVFPAGLPGDSANRNLLIATQGFADLHVVQPDYVVPNGFFPVPIPGAFISLASAWWYDYYNLPTDGVHAFVDPDLLGMTGTDWAVDIAVATNFAGEQHSINVPSPPPPPPPVWALDEVYSNIDGSVQFVVHSTAQSGQQFLSGYTLVATPLAKLRSHHKPPVALHTFVFPNDLPGDSANRSFLVATKGFADLHILQPDYIVPNGFFPLQGGIISVAGHSYQYPAPTRDGVTAVWQEPEVLPFFIDAAIAITFAGQQYTFVAPPPLPPPPPCQGKHCRGHN